MTETKLHRRQSRLIRHQTERWLVTCISFFYPRKLAVPT